MADFPEVISLTLTNTCNLRCRMCGQWGPTGYLNPGKKPDGKIPEPMPLARWLDLIDEAARLGVKVACVRGGEPFLFPGIIEVLRRLKERGLVVNVDSNGTVLEKYAEQVVEAKVDYVTLSLDGPEEIHDRVRGVPGTFRAAARGVKRLREAEKANGSGRILNSICFTISPDSLAGLPEMPGVVRSLDIGVICANPYYYFPEAVGREYEEVLRRELGCRAYSWRGFHREDSGVDPEEFLRAYREFQARLGDVQLYPFMPFSEEEYRDWFSGSPKMVGRFPCTNPLKLIDIQPSGDANFCVDFPDYVFGNVARKSIEEIWTSREAERFRKFIAARPLPICNRCGAKYMA